MSLAPKYNPSYTVADYQDWKGDWELIDGVAISMSPSPFGPHQKLAAEFLFQFKSQLKSHACLNCHVLYEIDWIVNQNTVVRPDLLITCEGVPPKHVTRPPTLIVEILSTSTKHKDLTIKSDLYADAGVKYYLLADPVDRSLVVNKLQGKQYQSLAPAEQYTLQLRSGCEIKLDVKEIFEL